MTKTYVITVAGSPKSVNAKGGGVGAHHMVTHREKKEWEGLFLLELMAARVSKGMEHCNVEVTVRYKHKSGGKGRDVENMRHPVLKPLFDALVKGGYIADDTDEWLHCSDFTLEEGPPEWPHRDPRVKSEMIVKLDATYL